LDTPCPSFGRKYVSSARQTVAALDPDAACRELDTRVVRSRFGDRGVEFTDAGAPEAASVVAVG